MDNLFITIHNYIKILANIIRPYSNYVFLGAKILISILLFAAILGLIVYLNETHLIKKQVVSIFKNISNSNKKRLTNQEKQNALYGVRQGSWINKYDELLKYSGFIYKHPWTKSTEYFVIALFSLCFFVLVIGSLIFNIGTGIILSVLTYILIIGYLGMLRRRNYKKVGQTILSFANLISSYSSSSDDIISILNRTTISLEDPLRSAVESCCMEAKKGNVIRAMKNLEDSIEYAPFKTLIRNLSIAANNEANYTKVVDDARKMIRDRLSFEDSLMNVYSKSRTETLLLTIIGLASCFLLTDMIVGMPFLALIQLMLHSFGGRIILIMFVASLLASAYVALIGMGKGGR